MTVYEPLLALNWNLLFSAITVLILFLILKKFFFEKVHNFMEERENEVRTQLETAAENNKLADEKLRDYEEKIKNYELEGRDIIKTARNNAKVQAKNIINDAEAQAHKTLMQSEAEIERQKNNARKELKEEIGELAIMAAERIMERELSDRNQSDIVDKIIKEAEDEKWS